MRSQFNCSNIDIEKLIQCIEKETVENNHIYIVAADDMSNSNLQHRLEIYIKSTVYDTRFGDSVPVIIANALCVNIAVVSEIRAESRILNYRNFSLISYSNTIFVSKTGEHYDGMRVRKLASVNRNCACNICCHNAAVPTQTHGNMQLSDVGSERTQPSEAPCEIDDPINDVDSRGSGFCCSTVVTETKHVQSEISSPVTNQMSKCTGKQLSNNNIKHANNEETLHERIYTGKPPCPQTHMIETAPSKDSVSFCSWNINGLTMDKLNDDILGKFLKSHDIILLVKHGPKTLIISPWVGLSSTTTLASLSIKRPLEALGGLVYTYEIL